MFSGIHSLIFGKKQHRDKHDDTTNSQTSADDFVVLERRHSDDSDKNSGLYPSLDPSHPTPGNLPYATFPSLPDLRDHSSASQNNKEEPKVDMLQGVPFVLCTKLLLIDGDENSQLQHITSKIKDFKKSKESAFSEYFMYDFEVEHSVCRS